MILSAAFLYLFTFSINFATKLTINAISPHLILLYLYCSLSSPSLSLGFLHCKPSFLRPPSILHISHSPTNHFNSPSLSLLSHSLSIFICLQRLDFLSGLLWEKHFFLLFSQFSLAHFYTSTSKLLFLFFCISSTQHWPLISMLVLVESLLVQKKEALSFLLLCVPRKKD